MIHLQAAYCGHPTIIRSLKAHLLFDLQVIGFAFSM